VQPPSSSYEEARQGGSSAEAVTLQVPDRESRGKEFALAVQDEC
jgi:hypothetical protein